MLDTWRRFRVDEALGEASRAGKILAGLSAGALCWFDGGWSDYQRMEGGEDYALLPCLGLLPGEYCPHYNHDVHHAELKKKVEERKRPMLCLTDDAAAWVENGSVAIHTSQCEAFGVMLEPDGTEKRLEIGEEYPWPPRM